ncbi:Putative transferase CAF17, mitochondrial [Galdieria sulphuraria]|nr:Putative transferase CAF17, mitochondrial [Galdieria sulphuraria]
MKTKVDFFHINYYFEKRSSNAMSCWRSPRFLASLHDRYLLKLSGKDTTKFLQGLITQNVELLTKQSQKPTLGYTGFLNKRGRLINQGFLAPLSESCEDWLIDVHPSTGSELVKHLQLFRLRSKVEISNVSDSYSVWVAPGLERMDQIWSDFVPDKPTVYSLDPRVSRLGLRFYTSIHTKYQGQKEAQGSEELYHVWRMIYGIPEGGTDYSFLNSLPFEGNLDYLNGISFSKGCYLGQETTARVNYTGVVRKRIAPVLFAKEKDKGLEIAQAMNHFYECPNDAICPIQTMELENGLSTVPVNSQLFAQNDKATKAVGYITSSVYNIGLARLDVASAFPNGSSVIGIPLNVEQSKMYAIPLKPFWWPREDMESSQKATFSGET